MLLINITILPLRNIHGIKLALIYNYLSPQTVFEYFVNYKFSIY